MERKLLGEVTTVVPVGIRKWKKKIVVNGYIVKCLQVPGVMSGHKCVCF